MEEQNLNQQPVDPGVQQPVNPGFQQPYQPPMQMQTQPVRNPVPPMNGAPVTAQKSKITAILLALFLGGLGIHNFYLGYTNKAIAQLVIYLVSIPLMAIIIGFFTIFIPGIWAFVELIMLVTGSIKTDGNGIPLKD